jgi:hypothetical protein
MADFFRGVPQAHAGQHNAGFFKIRTYSKFMIIFPLHSTKQKTSAVETASLNDLDISGLVKCRWVG